MKATIPQEHRKLFERYGENVVGLVLAGGFNPAASELSGLYVDGPTKLHAGDWLQERAHQHLWRERRLEILEWGIVALIAVEIIRPCIH